MSLLHKNSNQSTRSRERRRQRRRVKSSTLPIRLHVLLWISGILMVMLGARLFYMQILQGSYYKSAVRNSNTYTRTTNVQRGLIFDSTGSALVTNQAHKAVTYTKSSGTSSSDVYKLANRLSKYLTVDTDNLSTADQEAYYLANTKNYQAVLKKIKTSDADSSTEQYEKALRYLEKHPSVYKLTASQKNSAQLYTTMNSSYTMSTTYLKKSGVTSKKIAEIGEHLSQLPGIKLSTAWTRKYADDDITSLTGSVSTNGLPSDQLKTLLAQGYSRNDSVGTSLLEKQYQSALAGIKGTTKITTNGNKVTKEKATYAGQRGSSLVLTINYNFQKKVQQILSDNYSSAGNTYSTGVYAVVMNPNTGAVYAMAGIDRDPSTGKETVDETGAITQAMTMGSVVKGATLIAGFLEGVITPSNNTLTDMPIKLAGTSAKTSWFNKTGSANQSLTAAQALQVSSNSYMMQIAMKIGGFTYRSGAHLALKSNIFSKLRYYYNMVGLGTKTGIDLPGEVSGYEGSSTSSDQGKALDLSYGNYDEYTVMQLAQYMSTIANGGKKMKPYLVKQIRQTTSTGSLGKVEYTAHPTVQSTLPVTKSELNIIKRGLYLVTHGTDSNTTAKSLGSETPSISGKTGTAETYYNGNSTTTLSFAGYAPSDNPQVVVALAINGATDDDSGANITMAKEIFSAYWSIVKNNSSSN